MNLLFNVAKFVSPDALVHANQRSQFDAILPGGHHLADFLNVWWDDPGLIKVTPNLIGEGRRPTGYTAPLQHQGKDISSKDAP